MATYLITHEVDDVDRWWNSPRREEIFGPMGITMAAFRDPASSNKVGLIAEIQTSTRSGIHAIRRRGGGHAARRRAPRNAPRARGTVTDTTTAPPHPLPPAQRGACQLLLPPDHRSRAERVIPVSSVAAGTSPAAHGLRSSRGKPGKAGSWIVTARPRAVTIHQRKRMLVKWFRRVSGVCGEWVLIWGSCYGWRWLLRAWRCGPAAGMRKFRAGRWPSAARSRVPVTRVFSLYVVQAGSACPRVRAGLPRQRSTGLVRSSGRPGESCPGLSAGWSSTADAGSLSPSSGRKVSGTRGGCGRTKRWSGGLRLAARGVLAAAAPEATAGSQLVPWTTME